MSSETLKKENVTSEDVLNLWSAHLRECQELRYLHVERPELLSMLGEMLTEYNVSFEEAKGLKRVATLKLITEEGLKNKGKYKNWKKHIDEDFDATITSAYIDFVPASEAAPVKTTIESDLFITRWVEKHFNNPNRHIIDEAHTIGSILNMKFLENYIKDLGDKK